MIGAFVTSSASSTSASLAASRAREILHEQHDGRAFVVYRLTDSLRKPQGRPPAERADWKRAA